MMAPAPALPLLLSCRFRRRRSPRAVALAAGLLLVSASLSGQAAEPAKSAAANSSFSLGPSGPSAPGEPAGGSQPVNIQADNAIEWHQDQNAYVARGHASATRGTTTIQADVLTAYYRQTKDKGTDVFRMTAEGNVHITTPTQQVFGQHGEWDNDKQVGIITGPGLKLTTATDVVTARDSFEYFDATKLAVARGEAIAVRGQDRMRADTLVAQFAQGGASGTTGASKSKGAPSGKTKSDPASGTAGGGGLEMQRLDGVGNVVVTTATDVARSRRLMYSVPTEIAILVGDVKITRGEDQVNGDTAEMNMKTHVNRVMSSGHRVESLLHPKDKNQPGQNQGARSKPSKPPSP